VFPLSFARLEFKVQSLRFAKDINLFWIGCIRYKVFQLRLSPEQSGRLLGIANKFIHLLAIPSSLSRSYSTFPLCSGDNLDWNSCIRTLLLLVNSVWCHLSSIGHLHISHCKLISKVFGRFINYEFITTNDITAQFYCLFIEAQTGLYHSTCTLKLRILYSLFKLEHFWVLSRKS
jgi:hypothetical protein